VEVWKTESVVVLKPRGTCCRRGGGLGKCRVGDAFEVRKLMLEIFGESGCVMADG
jgi:hypothetical protein